MSTKPRLRLSNISIALLTALSSSTTTIAFAEEEKSTGPKIEVIEVTAQKRAQSINEVPLSITAFNGEMLNEKGIENSTDLAASVPGFAFSESHSGVPIYTMRGVGFNESSAQASATVGVYVNEVATPFPIMTRGPMLDIERVEVLKGPQGTLYGRNSTGGAINYITAKPTEDFEAGVKTSVGNYQTVNVEGFVSGGLSESVQARLAVKSLTSGEGWQKSATRDAELGKKDKLAVRFSLAAQLSDSTTADFTYNYWTDKSDSTAPQLVHAQYAKPEGHPVREIIESLFAITNPAPIGDDATIADWSYGETPSVNLENQDAALTINTELSNGMTFTSLTSYGTFTDAGSEYERGGVPGAPYDAVPDGFKSGYLLTNPPEFIKNDYSTTTSDIESFAQEFRLNGSSGIATWVAGVYYSDNEVVTNQRQTFELTSSTNLHPAISIANFPAVDNSGTQNSTTTAIFASADWQVSDELVITTGIRYTNDESIFSGCTGDIGDGSFSTFANVALPLFGLLPTSPNSDVGGCVTLDESGQSALVEKELNEDSLSWRFAANYSINSDTSVYASYSRGFKAGSFPTLAAFTSAQFEPVVQEQVDAYELGIKATVADGAAQINAAAFYYDYADKQLLTKIPDPIFGRLFALRNVPESNVTGAEVDIQWMLTDEFTITAAASYVNTEITDFVGTNQLGQELDFSGSSFPLTSELQSSITAEYEWQATENTFARIALDASYTGEANTDYEGVDDNGVAQYDDRFIMESYTLINARIGIYDEDETWSVYLWARNLTDEFYTNNTLMQTDMIVRYAGMPRTVGISFNYNWF